MTADESGTTPTVAEYVVARLAALGVGHVFGVPEDYAFQFNNAIEANENLRWVGCANELNAAYAADGYARVHGVSVLSTTFAVGELSALNGVMGALAERSAVIHLAGQPSTKIQALRKVTHHSLGDGEFGGFRPLSAASVCVAADLTPHNAVSETERVIREVRRQRRPGYITVAEDLALKPIAETPVPALAWNDLPAPGSDPAESAAAVAALLARLNAAASAVVLPAFTLDRYGLTAELARFLDVSGFGYATAPMDKGVLSEDHPQYLGMFNGMLSRPEVADAVRGADLVIDLGGVLAVDFSTGAWTRELDPAKTVTVDVHRTVVDGTVYSDVFVGDVLTRLSDELARRGAPTEVAAPPAPAAVDVPGSGDDVLSSAAFYPRFVEFLREGDVVVCETGLCQAQMGAVRLPKDVTYLVQVLWGSIGWATPAAFGAAMAAHDRRVVLITGEGSHQLTANEIGAMGRYGVKPVIVVLNNSCFGVEEMLADRSGHEYNDLAPWRYARIPAAMGCDDWDAVRVTTVAELEAALAAAGTSDSAVYIEVVLPRSDVPPSVPPVLLQQLYKADPPAAPAAGSA